MKKLLNRITFQYFLIIIFLVLCGISAYLLSSTPIKKGFKKVKDDSSKVVMVYMIGSDLESGSSAGTNDLKEIEKQAKHLKNTKVVVYTGGSVSWHNDLPSDKNCVLNLTKDGFETVYEENSKSMGEPSTLSSFLNYAHSNYKAEKYSLILWNHGSGPMIGYGFDSKHGDDSLTLVEMKTAMKNSPFKGDNKLSWIGFDACMMASAEMAVTIDDYADYMIASQEIEPYMGWDYRFLKDLDKYDANTTLHSIVDNYISSSEKYFKSKKDLNGEVTLAYFDLSKSQQLEDKVNSLFSKVADDVSGEYNIIARKRIGSHGVARYSTGSEYDLVDLKQLINQMKGMYPRESKEVLEALKESVKYNKTNTNGCEGISLYFPYYNKEFYDDTWRTTYKELGVFKNYQSFLSSYEQVWLGSDLMKIKGKELVPIEESVGQYTLKLSDEQANNYAKGSYRILKKMSGDLYAPIFQSNDVSLAGNELKAGFDGNITYVVSNGHSGLDKEEMSLKEVESIPGEHRFYNEGYMEDSLNSNNKKQKGYDKKSDSLPIDLRLSGKLGEKRIQINGIYPRGKNEKISTGRKKEIEPQDWKKLCVYVEKFSYLTRNKNGSLKPFEKWEKDSPIRWFNLSNAEGYSFEYNPIEDKDGEYYILFEFEDTQNNKHASELIPINVKKIVEKNKSQNQKIKEKNVNWNGESVELYNKGGISVKMTESVSKAGFNFEVQNKTNNNIYVYVDKLGLMGRYGQYGRCIIAKPKSYGTEYIETADVLWQENIKIKDVKSIKFCMYIINKDVDKTILNDTYYHINTSKMKLAKRDYNVYLGAKGERQRLFKDSDTEVFLENLGGIEEYGKEKFVAVLSIKNLTNKIIKWSSSGIIINGLFYEIREIEYDINPHMTQYVLFDDIELVKDKDSYEDAYIPSIDAIESAKIVMATNKDIKNDKNSVGNAYPIKLKKNKKTNNRFVSGKGLVFKTKNFVCSYIGTAYIKDKYINRKEWYFSAENKSNKNILINFNDFKTNKNKKGADTDYVTLSSIIHNNYRIVPAKSKVYFCLVTSKDDSDLLGIPSKISFKPLFLDCDKINRFNFSLYDDKKRNKMISKYTLFGSKKRITINDKRISKIK